MTIHPYDTLLLDNGASFLFTPCPGTKSVTLTSAVTQLKSAGAQAVVTLMYDSEMAKYGASHLPQECHSQGLKWFQFPISDDDAPNQDFYSSFHEGISQLLSILENKGTIAVHCKGGSGRTGLVIALIMVELGYDKTEITQKVQTIRPKALSHPSQVSFFDQYSRIT